LQILIERKIIVGSVYVLGLCHVKELIVIKIINGVKNFDAGKKLLKPTMNINIP